jgi:signal transduction histidine kinase
LAQDGIVTALEKQAEALRTRHKLQVSTDLPAEPSAPLETKQALYRIAQEALHNTVKHAHASEVGLALRDDDAGLVLEISDDGVGFDPSDAFPGHFGLRSMQERIARLGGQVEVTSSPGHGTRIAAWAPVRRDR